MSDNDVVMAALCGMALVVAWFVCTIIAETVEEARAIRASIDEGDTEGEPR